MRGLYFLVFLFSIGRAVFGHQLYRPSHVTELGFTNEQWAYFVPGADIVWIDYEALERDFPEIKKFTRPQIRAAILENFSLASELQWKLDEIVVYDLPRQRNPYRLIYHPLDYGRASVVPFWIGDVYLGLVDLKGTGNGVEREEEVQTMVTDYYFLRYRLKVDEVRSRTSRRKATEFGTAVEELKKSIEQAAEGDLERLRSLKHDLVRYESHRNLADIHLRCVEKREKNSWAKCREESKAYLRELRRLDYFNGSAGTKRLLKEVAVQKPSERIITEYNFENASAHTTIDSYFVLNLPTRVYTPGGLVSGGIIGRQAHWRVSRGPKFTLPPDIPIRGVLRGGLQFDALGALVDFELPEVTDPRVADVLGYVDGQGQAIERQIDRAFNRWRAGDRDACQRVIDELMARFPRLEPGEARPPEISAQLLLKRASEASHLPDVSDRTVVNLLAMLSTTAKNPFLMVPFILRDIRERPALAEALLMVWAENKTLETDVSSIEWDLLFALFQADSARAARVLEVFRTQRYADFTSIVARLIPEMIRREVHAAGESFAGVHLNSTRSLLLTVEVLTRYEGIRNHDPAPSLESIIDPIHLRAASKVIDILLGDQALSPAPPDAFPREKPRGWRRWLGSCAAALAG